MLVLLNCTPSDEMKQEGIAREVVNKIQKLRKKVSVTIMVAMYHITSHVHAHSHTFNAIIIIQ